MCLKSVRAERQGIFWDASRLPILWERTLCATLFDTCRWPFCRAQGALPQVA